MSLGGTGINPALFDSLNRYFPLSRKDPKTIRTLLVDDFSPPTLPWTMKDIFGAADTSTAQTSPFCRIVKNPYGEGVQNDVLQLYGGNVVADAIQADTKLSVALEDNIILGAEIVYGFTNEQLEENNRLELVVEKFTGAEEQKGTLRHTPSTFVLEMESPDGTWNSVETNARGSNFQTGMWNYLRLEIDYRPATPTYHEAQFNDLIFRQPVIPATLAPQADTTGKRMGIEFHLWNNTGTVFGAEYFLKFAHLYKLR